MRSSHPGRPTPHHVGQLLHSGLAAQKAGRLAEAAELYNTVLRHDPTNADALQLLGLLAKSQRDFGRAEHFMLRSLAARPAQPNVLGNLGNLYLAMGRFVEALARFEDVAKLSPPNPDIHVGRAKALRELGRFEAADAAVSEALRISPHHIGALIEGGRILTSQDRHREAEIRYRQALDRSPDSPVILNNLGLSLRHQGRLAEAEPYFRRAVSLSPNLKEAWQNLANVVGLLGRHDESIEFYRRVLNLDPLYRDAHTNLNRKLWSVGRTDEVLISVAEVLKIMPDSPEALALAAEVELEYGAVSSALTHIRRAAAIAPNDGAVLRTLGLALLKSDMCEAALEPLARAARIAPSDGVLVNSLATAQLRSGRIAEALETLQQHLLAHPYDQLALAIQGTAWRLQSDARYAWLDDLDRCIAYEDLPAPDGWADMDRYLDDLASVLDRLHDTTNEPPHLTLRHGTQTAENLFGVRAERPIEALAQAVLDAVGRFVDRLPDDPAHPFFGRKASMRLSFQGSWSSRLRRGGHHTHHVHSKGWISGVFYVQLPDVVASGVGEEGWLTFGVPNLGPEIRLDAVRSVQPKRGRLVLFPSYMWHGTVPFQDDAVRTTIAFDLI